MKVYDKNAAAMKSCRTSEDKPRCFLQIAQSQKGVLFSADLVMLIAVSFRICDKDFDCIYKIQHGLLEKLQINKFWFAENISKDSRYYKEISDAELSTLEGVLRKTRTLHVKDFERTPAGESKNQLLQYVKLLDEKILEIQKYRKN